MESSPQNEDPSGLFRVFFKSALQAVIPIALVGLPATGIGYMISELSGFPLFNSKVIAGGLGAIMGGLGYLLGQQFKETNKH